MLFLLFQIGGERYALDVAGVLEVVPCVPLQRVAYAPVSIAGLLDYHGTPVPVLDLHALATGERAGMRFGTRLILVRAGPERMLALLAERATGTLRCEESDWTSTGLNLPGAPYLGPVTADAEGFIQRVRLDGLLSGPMRALLSGGNVAVSRLTEGQPP